MLKFIIWSKNRSSQLDLLLRSLQLNCKSKYTIDVIYTWSNEEFGEGYDSLDLCGKYDISMIPEKDFYQDTLNAVQGDYICLCTDDTVFYRQFALFNIQEVMTKDVVTFSLRYGLNTTLQNCFTNLYQPPLANYEEIDNTIKWSHRNYHPHMNYGYPFGLDAHIYRKEDLLKWMKSFHFNNTNELESNFFKLGPTCAPNITSFRQSVAVNIPWSNLSGVTKSNAISLEDMNKNFLEDKRISLDTIIESADEVVGSHQELSLIWE